MFCGNKPKCPAINTAVATVAQEYGQLPLPENFHSSAITSPSDMSRALDAAAIVERWAKSVRHHAMERGESAEALEARDAVADAACRRHHRDHPRSKTI